MNKQYTKEEYEELVPKIIEHMMKNPLLEEGGSPKRNEGETGDFMKTSNTKSPLPPLTKGVPEIPLVKGESDEGAGGCEW